MAFLSAGTIRRVLTALSSQKSGNEVLGSWSVWRFSCKRKRHRDC